MTYRSYRNPATLRGTPKTIIVRLPDWSRYEAEVVKVTHHTDAGHKYSRVEHRLPDGGTTQVILQGHFGNH